MSQLNLATDFRGLFIVLCQHETETSQTSETTQNLEDTQVDTRHRVNEYCTVYFSVFAMRLIIRWDDHAKATLLYIRCLSLCPGLDRQLATMFTCVPLEASL